MPPKLKMKIEGRTRFRTKGQQSRNAERRKSLSQEEKNRLKRRRERRIREIKAKNRAEEAANGALLAKRAKIKIKERA